MAEKEIDIKTCMCFDHLIFIQVHEPCKVRKISKQTKTPPPSTICSPTPAHSLSESLAGTNINKIPSCPHSERQTISKDKITNYNKATKTFFSF